MLRVKAEQFKCKTDGKGPKAKGKSEKRKKREKREVETRKEERRGGIAQLARAPALQAGGQRFESVYLHHERKEGFTRNGLIAQLVRAHAW